MHSVGCCTSVEHNGLALCLNRAPQILSLRSMRLRRSAQYRAFIRLSCFSDARHASCNQKMYFV
jgi:hypothetical protein